MSTPVHGSANHDDEKAPEKEDSIFLDVADMRGYDKNLKTARIYLYIIAAIQIGFGVYTYYSYREYDEQIALISGGIVAGLGIVFIVLAIWSYKMASAAFLTALIVYIAANVYTIIEDQSQIYKGVILKVLVIIALIKGFKDAKEYEQMKRTLGTGTPNV